MAFGAAIISDKVFSASFIFLQTRKCLRRSCKSAIICFSLQRKKGFGPLHRSMVEALKRRHHGSALAEATP